LNGHGHSYTGGLQAIGMQALGDEARSSGMGCDRVVADGAVLLVVAFKVKGVQPHF